RVGSTLGARRAVRDGRARAQSRAQRPARARRGVPILTSVAEERADAAREALLRVERALVLSLGLEPAGRRRALEATRATARVSHGRGDTPRAVPSARTALLRSRSGTVVR